MGNARLQSAPPEPPPSSAIFFDTMRRIVEFRASMLADESWSALTGRLRILGRSFVEKFEQLGPVPPRIREQLDALTTTIDELATADISNQLPLEEYPGTHPVLELLINENFAHLERQFGREVAERAFNDVFKSVCRPRKRGRPPRISVEAVQKAKALRDKGQSYDQIGRKVGLTRTQVRSALKHHFPNP